MLRTRLLVLFIVAAAAAGCASGPASVDTPAVQLAVPTPAADLSTVTGQLITPGPGGDPYLATLYLARSIEADQPGFPPVVAFSQDTDPKAEQDNATGQFVFTDVPPGQYAIIIWNPLGGTIINDPASGESLVLQANPGEVVDLGVIYIP